MTQSDRALWISLVEKLALPVLEAGVQGRLHEVMPFEGHPDRREVAPLEAVRRLLSGLAPWLESDAPPEERELQARLRELARATIIIGADPSHPGRFRWDVGEQPLVEAAFVSRVLLHAPRELWQSLPDQTRQHLLHELRSTRRVLPHFNNWLLFAATVETFLASVGEEWDSMRVDYALRQHEQWYLGDGTYGDGPAFHFDYYNSLAIHPLLCEVLDRLGDRFPAWQQMIEPQRVRFARHVTLLERMIAPDGSYPLVGRSLSYRCGVFHALALAALRHELPPGLSPGSVRCALTAVIRRTLEAPGTFDDKGWLRLGVCGHQPSVAERYISTGSCYACLWAFLPLGLPPSDPFWADPPAPWTSQRAWSSEDLAADKHL